MESIEAITRKSPISAQKLLHQHYLKSDANFDTIYPQHIQLLAKRHWTSLVTAKSAARFLSPSAGLKILDIGSGVGKFCLAGAYHQPQAAFYGIEQRQDLVGHARDAANALQLSNATFIHGNFQSVDFHEYDHFYFYNSFYEHLVEEGKIDQHIHYCGSLYYQYHRNLYQKLADMPIGTRLATLHTDDEHIPSCYCVVDTNLGGLLKYLVKI